MEIIIIYLSNLEQSVFLRQLRKPTYISKLNKFYFRSHIVIYENKIWLQPFLYFAYLLSNIYSYQSFVFQ